MKYLKYILGIGLIGAALVFGKDAYGALSYKNELRAERKLIEEARPALDPLTKELIEKIDNFANKEKAYVKISEVKDLNTGNIKKKIEGEDLDEGILISGLLPGQVFIRKGGDRYWIDTDKKIYYHDVFKNYKEADPDELTRAESFIRGNFLKEPFSKVEKIDSTYKVTRKDELNFGSYKIFDENGEEVEAYINNSQGEFLEKLLAKDKDVLKVYDKFKALTDTYEETRREDFY